MKQLINTQKKRNGILVFSILAGLVVLGVSASAFMPEVNNESSKDLDMLDTAQYHIWIYGADGDGQVYWRYPVNHATETEEIVYADFEDGTPFEVAQDIAEELNIDLDINIVATAYYEDPNSAFVCIQEKRTGSQYEGNRANLGNLDGNLNYNTTSVLLDVPGTCPVD